MSRLGTYSSASIRGWSASGGSGSSLQWSLFAQLSDELTAVYSNGSFIVTGNPSTALNPDGITYWYQPATGWNNYPDRDSSFNVGDTFNPIEYQGSPAAITGFNVETVYNAGYKQIYTNELLKVVNNSAVFSSFDLGQVIGYPTTPILWRRVNGVTYYCWGRYQDASVGTYINLTSIESSPISAQLNYPNDQGAGDNWQFTGLCYYPSLNKYFGVTQAPNGVGGYFLTWYFSGGLWRTTQTDVLNFNRVYDIDCSSNLIVITGQTYDPITITYTYSVAYSTNGTTWNKSTTPIAFNKIRYSGTKFFTLGNGEIYSSSDAITWTKEITNQTDITDINPYGSGIVAVTNSGKVLVGQ